MKKRINCYDTISALLIIGMIGVHIFQWGHVDYMNTAGLGFLCKHFFFVIPYFYFKSGIFYKSRESWTDLLRRSYQRLIVPYIAFTALGLLVSVPFESLVSSQKWYVTIGMFMKQILLQGSCPASRALWFLPSLFFVKLLFKKIMENNLEKTIILFPFVGYLLSVFEWQLPLGLQSLFPGIFIYYSGYLYKKNKKLRSGWAILVPAVFFGAVQILLPSQVDVRVNHLIYGEYFLWLLASIAGVVILIRGVSFFPRCYKFLLEIGANSMSYYASHWFVIVVITQFFVVCGWTGFRYGWGYVMLLSLSMLLILPVINFCLQKKFLRWMGVYPGAQRFYVTVRN